MQDIIKREQGWNELTVQIQSKWTYWTRDRK